MVKLNGKNKSEIIARMTFNVNNKQFRLAQGQVTMWWLYSGDYSIVFFLNWIWTSTSGVRGLSSALTFSLTHVTVIEILALFVNIFEFRALCANVFEFLALCHLQIYLTSLSLAMCDYSWIFSVICKLS